MLCIQSNEAGRGIESGGRPEFVAQVSSDSLVVGVT